MNIGFYLKWEKASFDNPHCNIYGDELLAESFCKYFRKLPTIDSVEVYAPNCKPRIFLDVLIYLNDTKPIKRFAKKHILYLQNAYSQDSYRVLKRLRAWNYDGYAFISEELKNIHENDGYHGICLPFGVDAEVFHPKKQSENFRYDVTYIGNNIKGAQRTKKYLLPAIHYHIGLFGRWGDPPFPILVGQHIPIFMKQWLRFIKWIYHKHPFHYSKVLNMVCQGKIPQKDVPVLYSSSKINLNFTAADSVKWNALTLRMLEVLACKGFVITDETKLAKTVLQKCVVCAKGGKDLTQKIEYFLKHQEKRDMYMNNGYKYVLTHALIQYRVNDLYMYLRRIL